MTRTKPDPERTPGPVLVIVRDGWGHNPNSEHDAFNAVKLASTPLCDRLRERYPWTLIQTSGRAVGLPEGTMGNSEVGHQNIGAGRVVNQESVRITAAIEDGSFFDNPALTAAAGAALAGGGAVHLMGIASDAGVHGRLEHLFACVELCKRVGLGRDQVRLHLFTDGRDTGPFTGADFINTVEAELDRIGVGRIVSLIGRYYAMDRDNRWERVARAYGVLTGAADDTPRCATAAEAVQSYYDHPAGDSQQGDEFITPRIVAADADGAAATRVKSGDAVFFYNYRGDRPRELVRAFMQDDFRGNVPPSPDSGERGFDRGDQLDLRFVCMTQYDETFNDYNGVSVAFEKTGRMPDIGGDVLAAHGLTQYRCAETEKFPHVTFFANDYREDPFDGEHREMAQSPKVATYDLQPEMSAEEIRDDVLARLKADDCEDFFLVNFANGDMVGHTGKLRAAVLAVETVDQCVGAIVEAALEKGGRLIVTADHGNAEQMFDPVTNAAHTAHTLYDVECILVDPALEADRPLRHGGALCDVMPTALAMLGLDKPDAMTGRSLLEL